MNVENPDSVNNLEDVMTDCNNVDTSSIFTGSERMTRTGKAGSGTYGIVYTANVMGKPKLKLAIKRNIIDDTVDFNGSIRELDILSKLKGHPYIVDIQGVSVGNPFFSGVMSPIKDRSFKEDNLHFIFKEANSDCCKFMDDKSYNLLYAKIAMFEVLLGVEYMHSKGIIHRDIKPSNILLFMDGTTPSFKLCDFGLSKPYTTQGYQTPRVVTSWYRAPEIAASDPYYTQMSDMWSMACIFYELVTRRAFLNGVRDDDSKIVNKIIELIPYKLETKEINNVIKYGDVKVLKSTRSKHMYNIKDRMNLSDTTIAEFNSTSGSYSQFVDLLSKMFVLDPVKRLSATEALNHPFFVWTKPYISHIRQLYPPVPIKSPTEYIINCIERKWMICVAFNIFNAQHELAWYKHRILFQSISLFDRYISRAYNSIDKSTIESLEMGRLHSKFDTQLRYLVCLYVAIKYFSVMESPCTFCNLVMEEFKTDEALLIAEQFELTLIKDILGYNIYQPTLYEAVTSRMNDKDVRNLMSYYGNLTDCSNLTVDEIYENYLNKCKQYSKVNAEEDKKVKDIEETEGK